MSLCDLMDGSLPNSSVHGIILARILEQIDISFSRESSWPRDQTCISCTGSQLLYHRATGKPLIFIDDYILLIKSLIPNNLWSLQGKQTENGVKKHHLQCFNTVEFTFLNFKIKTVFHDSSSNPIFQVIENIFQLLLSDFINWICDLGLKFLQIILFGDFRKISVLRSHRKFIQRKKSSLKLQNIYNYEIRK